MTMFSFRSLNIFSFIALKPCMVIVTSLLSWSLFYCLSPLDCGLHFPVSQKVLIFDFILYILDIWGWIFQGHRFHYFFLKNVYIRSIRKLKYWPIALYLWCLDIILCEVSAGPERALQGTQETYWNLSHSGLNSPDRAKHPCPSHSLLPSDLSNKPSEVLVPQFHSHLSVLEQILCSGT